jgi:hypothetical protein
MVFLTRTEEIERQQCDLIAPDGQQGEDYSGCQAAAPGGALKGSRQQPQRNRRVAQAKDFARVLQARIGRTAEREGQCRDKGAGRVP